MIRCLPLQVRMGHCSLSLLSTSDSTRISVTVSLTLLLCDSWECDVLIMSSGESRTQFEIIWLKSGLWSVQDPSTKRRSRKRRRGSRMKSCVFLPSQRFPLVGHAKLYQEHFLIIYYPFFVDLVSSWLISSLLIDSCCSSVRLGQHSRVSSWSTSNHYMELPAVHHGCSPPASTSHSEKHRRYGTVIVAPCFLSSSPHYFWGSHDILFMFIGCGHNFLRQLCCGWFVVWSCRRLQPAVWPAPWLLWWWWERCAHLFLPVIGPFSTFLSLTSDLVF